MKPVVKKARRVRVRLRPGGLLIIRPLQLRALGWSPKETWLYELAAGRIILFKKPSETQWRIERLRKRLDTQRMDRSLGCAPRTTAEFRALGPSPWKPRAPSRLAADLSYGDNTTIDSLSGREDECA